MGVAAYNRGSAAISRQYAEEAREMRHKADIARAVIIEHEADTWRREAMEFALDAKGFAGMAIRNCIERNDRTYAARLRKVNEAHAAWLDVNPFDPLARVSAAIEYAVAYYRLLDWMRACWKVEVLDRAPSPVKRRAA